MPPNVDGDGDEDLLVGFSDGERGGLRLWRREGRGWVSVLPDEIAGPAAGTRFVDFDNDGVFDVVAVGRGGLRLLRGDSTGVWQDVTAPAGLSPEPGGTVELVDADNEGDLDFCTGSKEGVRLWQNRLDGTFREVSEQAGLSGLDGGIAQVAAFDHDDDGDVDLLGVEDAGGLRLFDNLRQGRFVEAARGLDTTACRSVLAADLDNNGRLDLVLVGRAGSVWIQYNTGKGFGLPGVKVAVDGVSVRALTAFDFDNGRVDGPDRGRHPEWRPGAGGVAQPGGRWLGGPVAAVAAAGVCGAFGGGPGRGRRPGPCWP